jgi:hypothetical protein
MLILKVCSAVHMDCLPAINDSFVFNSWSECASAGYLRSIKIINSIDSSIVNENKMVVNFQCVQTEESTKFWEKVKNYVKDKIKKIICKCKKN